MTTLILLAVLSANGYTIPTWCWIVPSAALAISVAINILKDK